jgi:hypothetical protein
MALQRPQPLGSRGTQVLPRDHSFEGKQNRPDAFDLMYCPGIAAEVTHVPKPISFGLTIPRVTGSLSGWPV